VVRLRRFGVSAVVGGLAQVICGEPTNTGANNIRSDETFESVVVRDGSELAELLTSRNEPEFVSSSHRCPQRTLGPRSEISHRSDSAGLDVRNKSIL